MNLSLSDQAGKKSREEKGSVNIWELDNNNSDVDSDSPDESDTNNYLTSILCFLLFFPPPSYFSVFSNIHILFCLPHFA